MLGHRLRRLPNIMSTLAQRIVLNGVYVIGLRNMMTDPTLSKYLDVHVLLPP